MRKIGLVLVGLALGGVGPLFSQTPPADSSRASDRDSCPCEERDGRWRRPQFMRWGPGSSLWFPGAPRGWWPPGALGWLERDRREWRRPGFHPEWIPRPGWRVDPDLMERWIDRHARDGVRARVNRHLRFDDRMLERRSRGRYRAI